MRRRGIVPDLSQRTHTVALVGHARPRARKRAAVRERDTDDRASTRRCGIAPSTRSMSSTRRSGRCWSRPRRIERRRRFPSSTITCTACPGNCGTLGRFTTTTCASPVTFDRRPGGTWKPDHMPPQPVVAGCGARPNVEAVIEQVLKDAKYPPRGFRSCLGILSRYGQRGSIAPAGGRCPTGYRRGGLEEEQEQQPMSLPVAATTTEIPTTNRSTSSTRCALRTSLDTVDRRRPGPPGGLP